MHIQIFLFFVNVLVFRAGFNFLCFSSTGINSFCITST